MHDIRSERGGIVDLGLFSVSLAVKDLADRCPAALSSGSNASRGVGDTGIEPVIEVDRPNHQKRRKVGKSDQTDAVAAARAALSREATVTPKARNGPVEQIRVLVVARRSAREQRIQSLNQLRHLVFTAPEEIRVRFKDRPKTGLVSEAANMRPAEVPTRSPTPRIS
jgi:transposase